MNLQKRIEAFVELGCYLKNDFENEKSAKFRDAEVLNPWFTQENIHSAVNFWRSQLTLEMLNAWLIPYKLSEVAIPKKVLVIMAGNIPLVGFHDFLSVILSGNKVVVKCSSDDNVLIPFFIDSLIKIAPDFKKCIQFIADINDKKFDGVIATGSNASAKYFNYYFNDSKKIIRKNRRSIAVLDGTEGSADLKGLAYDIFAYFGLGCRNISKLFLPEGYDLNKLFEVFLPYSHFLDCKKYSNNYEYNKSIFLLGGNKLIENGFLLMKEDSSLHAPIAMLYYEYYDDISVVDRFIQENLDSLQCVVSKKKVQFGSTQNPSLWDYADGIDTIDFLRKL